MGGGMIERWMTLVGRVFEAGRTEVARAVYEDLIARYGASERRYHNLGHIQACLQLLDTVRGLAGSADAIELAIWFHDAIYDSHRSDNEECSAQLAAEALARLGAPGTLATVVSDLILATRHQAVPARPDAAILVDIDLAILGQPAAIFDAYEAGIRAEYGWVAEEDFRLGRSKVLRGFLRRPRIYATEYFHEALERAARENLARSLARLAA